MITRILCTLLCAGVLSLVTGCYVDPYGTSYGGYGYSQGYDRYGTYQGPYREYDRNDDEWRAYRRQRQQQEEYGDRQPAPPVGPPPGVPPPPPVMMPPVLRIYYISPPRKEFLAFIDRVA